ncbi:2-isopropylmalate synthase [Catenovulum maritimum]|uniref:2-isopropylmalate synthase n=1 Tax=Catenovulum maritimum TaxID=1513271 RepID=A0A0J8GSY2_9ALTE|nr:2-isopropylmalate synthase [Catenovulum maritimum]KMT65862.1 2-isopropylmalate synthase [Catenovulum maritimum]
MSDQVIIFDTTLRDGEQALSASLSVREKLQIALALDRLGVDVMEAGFPVSSPGDFESVKTIAQNLKHAIPCGLSRAVEGDIDACAQSLSVAERFRIHTFISTSTIHVEQKLKRSFDQVLEMGTKAVQYARKFTDDVEFSCEDAGRTPIDNLCRMVEAAIKAGATTVNIPDTVGYTIPSEFGGIIQTLYNKVPNIDQAVISVHCHNDLGLAVANSTAAVLHGARQIECTINGIGERAGNCSLEEVAMILNTRKDLFNVTTNINTKEIYHTSRLVSQLCNMPVQPNKAIVGANAFSHSSGIHQDGMLKAKNTYEIITPESIGKSTNDLNMTSRSGRHVIKHRMGVLGYTEDDYDLSELYASFVKLADRKGQVFDYDLEALLYFNQQQMDKQHYQLSYLAAVSGTDETATSGVKLKVGDEIISGSALGNGPVDATYRAILSILDLDVEVVDYAIGAKTGGEDAQAQTDIVVKYKGKKYRGMGLSTDIVEASAQALIHVLNLTYRADQIELQKQAKQNEQSSK